MINIVQDKKTKLSEEGKKRKRNISFQSYSNIKCGIEKENKENIAKNLFNTQIKTSLFDDKLKIIKGQTPIISKNKKIILITEDNYDPTLQRGKSPFFISDKISFRNEFKSLNAINTIKNKHLGLCDFYSKNNENEKKIMIYDVNESIFSKTPRFHNRKEN